MLGLLAVGQGRALSLPQARLADEHLGSGAHGAQQAEQTYPSVRHLCVYNGEGGGEEAILVSLRLDGGPGGEGDGLGVRESG